MGFLGLGGDKVSTQTNTIGKQDAAHITAGREAGRTAADAAMGTQVAGVDPLTGQALGQYGDLYNQYGQQAGMYDPMAANALGFAGQTGLSGLGGYMNPMLEQYFASQDPLWNQRYGQANMLGQQGATGQGAYGGARGELLKSDYLSNVMRQQMGQYGQVGYQAAGDAANLMMGERGRMGQLGMGLAGLGNQSRAGQMDVTRNQMLGGDYLRNIQNQQYQQPFRNAQNAAGMITGTQGQNIYSQSENRQEGSVLGDLMGIGGMVAGTLIGGPAGLAGGALGQLGGGGSAQQTMMNTPVGQSGGPNSNIWNYGGGPDYNWMGGQ